ncbi:MAG: hypothetical protein KME09_03545 [Pleurocapsa minor HA4230-MV1]|nr:hypothetical protein [Pleurocapsa minor HA4230-MV1]
MATIFSSTKRYESDLMEWRSLSLAPSIRVEQPMLSMVVTFINATNRSGANIPKAFQNPLNSSISAMRLSI